jgi:hypothetical protein
MTPRLYQSSEPGHADLILGVGGISKPGSQTLGSS